MPKSSNTYIFHKMITKYNYILKNTIWKYMMMKEASESNVA